MALFYTNLFTGLSTINQTYFTAKKDTTSPKTISTQKYHDFKGMTFQGDYWNQCKSVTPLSAVPASVGLSIFTVVTSREQWWKEEELFSRRVERTQPGNQGLEKRWAVTWRSRTEITVGIKAETVLSSTEMMREVYEWLLKKDLAMRHRCDLSCWWGQTQYVQSTWTAYAGVYQGCKNHNLKSVLTPEKFRKWFLELLM